MFVLLVVETQAIQEGHSEGAKRLKNLGEARKTNLFGPNSGMMRMTVGASSSSVGREPLMVSLSKDHREA